MAEDHSLIDRLGNVIYGVRYSIRDAKQGGEVPPMDGWIGRDVYMQFMRDAKPMLQYATEPEKLPLGEFRFLGVNFRRDMQMDPRSIVICAGGAPVRRLALDFPEYDKTPVVDHPSALALEIMALRYFERGDRTINPRFPEPTIDMINRLPKENEQPKMHSVSVDRLVELGLVFKEQRGQQIVIGLTLMGREALRQFEAAQ